MACISINAIKKEKKKNNLDEVVKSLMTLKHVILGTLPLNYIPVSPPPQKKIMKALCWNYEIILAASIFLFEFISKFYIS